MNTNKAKTIIKFSANWCLPCKVFKNTFEKVKEMEDFKDLTFREIDIENDDDSELLVERYMIQSVPTTVILDENDELIYKVMGNIPLKDFEDVVRKSISEREETT